MFGYVKPRVKDLLVKEHEFYRATYCGICRSMKKHTGTLSNVTITYDSVFLALVRMAYIEDSELGVTNKRCIAHPLKKKPMLNDNPAIEYTARAFAVLSYYKMLDDMSDEPLGKRMLVSLSRPILSSAKKKAKELTLEEVCREKLGKITELESALCPSVDEVAGLFGELLGEIFAYGFSDGDRLVLYEVGYRLGKFIYCIDAIDDYEKDTKSGSYNPYVIAYGGKPLTKENKETVRTALIFECKRLEGAINLVPFGNKVTVENIVRNIIYLGLTDKLDSLTEEEKEKEE